MNILALSGSLRKHSFNSGLLAACEGYLPDGATIVYFDCGTLPLYNEDLDGDSKPEAVQRLLDDIGDCDALLFAAPEYNHSISGVLKNAIDWASRPAYESVLARKPAGILSASKSMVGGARAQSALHQILDSTLTAVFPFVELLVPQAPDKFDDKGRLTDTVTLEYLERYVSGFTAWVKTFNA